MTFPSPGTYIELTIVRAGYDYLLHARNHHRTYQYGHSGGFEEIAARRDRLIAAPDSRYIRPCAEGMALNTDAKE